MSPKIDRSRPQTSLKKFNNIQKNRYETFGYWDICDFYFVFFLYYFKNFLYKCIQICTSKWVYIWNMRFYFTQYSNLHIRTFLYRAKNLQSQNISSIEKIFKLTISLRFCLRTQSFHSIHKYLVTPSDRGIFLLRLRKICIA